MRRILVMLAVAATLMVATPAHAITSGEPDGNRHPNVGTMILKLADGGLATLVHGHHGE